MDLKSENFFAQKEILKKRSMTFYDEDRAVETLGNISYYKIKEFANPFAYRVNVDGAPDIINYQGVKFETIISRYYQDKNFRIYLLHAIEDIEVALQTRIAFVLGEATGEYGYLDFSLWVNRNKNNDYIETTKKEIIRNLKYQLSRNQTKELEEKLLYGKNKEFPPVWLGIEMLMFGDLIKILRLMSNKNLTAVSEYFNCSNKELISWVGAINLVRNISAHNSNLIDINLRTRPIILDDWKKYISINAHTNGYNNNKISIILLIVAHFMYHINPKYNFQNIHESVHKLVRDDKSAIYFGFKSEQKCAELFPIKLKKRISRNKNRAT